MKIFYVSQKVHPGCYSDQYSAMVVVADNEDDAKSITPDGQPFGKWSNWPSNIDQLDCEELGEANAAQKRGVIISAYEGS